MVFLYDRTVYGLHYRGVQGNRKEWDTYGDRDPRLLCIPGDLGIHDLCVFSYGAIVVSSVYILLGTDRNCRDSLFRGCVPEDPVRKIEKWTNKKRTCIYKRYMRKIIRKTLREKRIVKRKDALFSESFLFHDIHNLGQNYAKTFFEHSLDICFSVYRIALHEFAADSTERNVL